MSIIAITESKYSELSESGRYGYFLRGAAAELSTGDYVTIVINAEDNSVLLEERITPSAGSSLLDWNLSGVRSLKPYIAVAKIIGGNGTEKASTLSLFTSH